MENEEEKQFKFLLFNVIRFLSPVLFYLLKFRFQRRESQVDLSPTFIIDSSRPLKSAGVDSSIWLNLRTFNTSGTSRIPPLHLNMTSSECFYLVV